MHGAGMRISKLRNMLSGDKKYPLIFVGSMHYLTKYCVKQFENAVM